MYYKLYRSEPEGKAVRGSLYRAAADGDQFVCKTLENLDYIIPALVYRLCVTKSPRFQRLMPLVCNVPRRAGIRIHPGSRPEHSRGCILVPNRGIEAGLTAELLRQQQSREEIRLEIISPK